MGIQSGRTGGGIFLWRQQLTQFSKLRCPILFAFIESIRQTAPANIAGENFLLFRAGLQPFCFQMLQEPDGVDIRLILCFCAASAQIIICDAKFWAFRWFVALKSA